MSGVRPPWPDEPFGRLMRLNVWMVRFSLALGFVLLPVLGAGCVRRAETAPEPQQPPGAAAPSSIEPAQKSATQDESFTTLDEAERALAVAEGELASLFAPPAPAEAPAAPPPPPAAGGASAPKGAEAEAEKKPASRCELACKAFSSLGRAAEAVCRLAGEQDARCSRARGAVDDNRRRVASCGCQSSP